MNEDRWKTWETEMEVVLLSKAEEWQLLGYDQVTKEDVWQCFLSKLPRLDVPDPVRPHWLAAELFHMKANDYMNWLTLQAYKGPNWFEDDKAISFD
ncbi:Post-transcriptional regulator [Evansella caseinilytica]|uniref:Post-transcriptional regulator n=1 Tax=Evansella caseinilytica TaxID=1503961 RepID=A0A1H3K617_9BACI|nr:post-transcriptional regulator [Evansella caseinilytica]SDY47626.1 Post-transcriptional regulator [Evansella caseinilytica]